MGGVKMEVYLHSYRHMYKETYTKNYIVLSPLDQYLHTTALIKNSCIKHEGDTFLSLLSLLSLSLSLSLSLPLSHSLPLSLPLTFTICSMSACLISCSPISSECWTLITTVWTRTGIQAPCSMRYSTVTCRDK